MGYSEGYTFLKAVRERDGAKAEEIIGRPGSTAINHREASTGEGALHILVRGRDVNWLGFMLTRGARPDAQSNDGTTPLILAAQIGWREGAEQLLARGANPNLGNRRGETPLIFAVQRRDLQMVRLLLSPARRSRTRPMAFRAIRRSTMPARTTARQAILRLLEASPRQ